MKYAQSYDDVNFRINLLKIFILSNIFFFISANYMFLRVALGWLSHGPKEMDDLAFEFQKASYGTSFRKPRLVASCLNIQINIIGESLRIMN